MVGAHVHVSNIGNGGGENGKEEFEEPSAELGRSLRLPSVRSARSSFSRASLPVYVSRSGRNHFQQREEMEGDPTLLPHDPAEFRDGEEEHRGPRSRGSALPGGGVEKNERWVILCSVILTSADRSLLQGCPWKHFRGGHIFHMVHGFQPSHGEEREERREPRGLLCISACCVCTPRMEHIVWIKGH